MSLRTPDLLFTAIAPAIWGSTYIVTTQYLPNFSPMTVAMLRALPAGLLLVMIVRQIPTGIWWMRIFILGALNISLFWSLLFISVYRLPGGVAATVGAVQPLMVVFISAALLGSPIRLMAVLGAICHQLPERMRQKPVVTMINGLTLLRSLGVQAFNIDPRRWHKIKTYLSQGTIEYPQMSEDGKVIIDGRHRILLIMQIYKVTDVPVFFLKGIS